MPLCFPVNRSLDIVVCVWNCTTVHAGLPRTWLILMQKRLIQKNLMVFRYACFLMWNWKCKIFSLAIFSFFMWLEFSYYYFCYYYLCCMFLQFTILQFFIINIILNCSNLDFTARWSYQTSCREDSTRLLNKLKWLHSSPSERCHFQTIWWYVA